jgi:uncharacterized protein YjbI with pentapeptide repeats
MTINPDQAKKLCFVHERIDEDNKALIRKSVCEELVCHQHGDNYHEFEGKSFCVLHLPSNTKVNEFKKLFEDKLKEKKYNFKGVWFPAKLKFPKEIYEIPVNFSYATFAAKAKFKDTVFLEEVNFSKAVFLADVNFDTARFLSKVDFYKTKFSANVFFKQSIFGGEAFFRTTTFLGEADFDESLFLAKANFDSAEFSESSEIFFKKTKFCEEVNFHYTIFAGYVLFEGNDKNKVFLDKTSTKKERKRQPLTFEKEKLKKIKPELDQLELKKSNLTGEKLKAIELEIEALKKADLEEECFLNLQDARIENPERVSFHTVRLEPNWFVNVNAGKFVFTACDWCYYMFGIPSRWRQYFKVRRRWRVFRASKLCVEKEIQKLKNRGFTTNPHKLLAKTCWQLADNYEVSKSFTRASMFRQLAQESNRKEELIDNKLRYLNGKKFWTWNWWYWLSSLYGESSLRAGLFLLGILLAFTFVYSLTTFQVCPSYQPFQTSLQQDEKNALCQLNPNTILCTCQKRGLGILDGEAFVHSLSTAAFQNVEYRKPISELSELFVILERIFAPLQAALLALAIRRKFMR